MSTTFDDLAARYIAVWNSPDPASRRRAVNELWAVDAGYVDPLVDAQGRDAIDRMIDTVQSQFPDFLFRLIGPVDGHHDQLRFSWELGPADGEAPIAGFDVAIVDADGRLREVRGFLDRVPTA
jgi:SnoaL-like protein